MNKLDCSHCSRVAFFDDLRTICPFCTSKFDEYKDVKKILNGKCPICSKKTKLTHCVYCLKIIKISKWADEDDLPHTVPVVLKERKSSSSDSFIGLMGELAEAFMKDVEEKDPLALALMDKVETGTLNKINNLFHDVNLQSAKNQAAIIIIQAEANVAKAKGDDAIYRANLMLRASTLIDEIPARFKPYVFSVIHGTDNTSPPDKIANDAELGIIVTKLEKEKLRKAKLDNEDLEDKYDSQKGI